MSIKVRFFSEKELLDDFFVLEVFKIEDAERTSSTVFQMRRGMLWDTSGGYLKTILCILCISLACDE